MPERIPDLDRRLAKLDSETDERHRENEKRFDKIESTLANVAGQLKVALALLIANGILSVYHGGHP